MPRILINEYDGTKPGSIGDYSNYSVLIAGFMQANPTKEMATARLERKDSNGVFEFTSASDFEKVIGLCPPAITHQEETLYYHYGNQMAYELLKMGYSVIYKPINETSDISTLTTDDFWSIFKDKANYDFRFISHGLLSSSDFDETLAALENKITAMQNVVLKLKEIEDAAKDAHETDSSVDEAKLIKDSYDALKGQGEDYKDYLGLMDPDTDKVYPDFATAKTKLTSGPDNNITKQQAQLEVLTAGKVTTNTINLANSAIARLACYDEDIANTGRGDCIALIEMDENKYISGTSKPESLIAAEIIRMTDIGTNGKYCAMTIPSVVYKMSDNIKFGNNKKFPGSFHYLACFINSLKSDFREWYAAAGYTRGTSSYIIDYTSVKLGELAINALEPRNRATNTDPTFACNVIANFRGSYYLWGNRTAHALGDKEDKDKGNLVASHFLNVRQLCTTIKKQLYVACRRFTFDPNSDTLWVNFCNAIKPTLEVMKADQGIRDYKIVKVVEENPKKATLKAKIRIIPIEAVEDFELEVSLEDSFGETAVNATESI